MILDPRLIFIQSQGQSDLNFKKDNAVILSIVIILSCLRYNALN
jgi:hypothetical protein